MSGAQGVSPGCGCGDLHRIDCVVTAASQPHAMVNDDGEVFYPDGPEDAAYFAIHHWARPLNEQRFRQAVRGADMTGPVWDGTGVDPWLPARLDAVLELAEAERTIWAAVWAALAAWLTGVAAAVLRGGRPDPQAVWSRVPAWTVAVTALADGVVLQVMGRAYRLLLEPGYRYRIRITVTTHLAEVRERLAGVPDEVYSLVAREIAEGSGLGESAGQLADRVGELLAVDGDRWSNRWQNRTTGIARSEALAAVNASRLDAATVYATETRQPLEQVWLAIDDLRTRPAHDDADGQRRPLGEPFTVGGFAMRFPGDPTAPAHLTSNCRCALAVVRPGGSTDLFSDRRI